MIEKEPSVKTMLRLWEICTKFIEEQRIYCEESVYQTDRVIENAYGFIHKVCDEVGYFEEEDEEDDS